MGTINEHDVQAWQAELIPRVRVFLESALELMEAGPGQGELRVQYEDGRVRRWRLESGWHGANTLSRFDANRLDSAVD